MGEHHCALAVQGQAANPPSLRGVGAGKTRADVWSRSPKLLLRAEPWLG